MVAPQPGRGAGGEVMEGALRRTSARAAGVTAGAERPFAALIRALSGNLGVKALSREQSVEIDVPV
jgi:hypothetical protein